MSYRSGPNSYPNSNQTHGHGSTRASARGDQAAARKLAARNSYTIVHAGKQMRIAPVLVWLAVGSVAAMGAWSAATATYFAFRDDVLTRLVARQVEMQYAYEDRIAELRSQVDRTTSRQMLDQEQFDQKLDQVVRRQSMLESRATALSTLPDVTVTGSIKPTGRGLSEALSTTTIPKPSPISDTVRFVAPPDREARLESRVPVVVAAVASQLSPQTQGMDRMINGLQKSLDQVESRQIATLMSVEEQLDSKMRRMRSAIADLGLNVGQIENSAPRAGVGGPFVPVKLSNNAGNAAFERQIHRINISRAQVEKLNRAVSIVPLRKPVVGRVEFSSGFGVRSDPFLGRSAMHTGLDFRASSGDPVRATANGTVVYAGWRGGYGRLIEISHGNGLTTRYGHLSGINVRVGQSIKYGQVVGAVGSTGRSTGPHLHYETRIGGEAVDPQKFLRAGVRLGAG